MSGLTAFTEKSIGLESVDNQKLASTNKVTFGSSTREQCCVVSGLIAFTEKSIGIESLDNLKLASTNKMTNAVL